jgi:putative ABC transport system permease protein
VTRSMASLLFGVGRADPVSFGAAALLFLVTAAAASAIPARRAARVDPVAVLRTD